MLTKIQFQNLTQTSFVIGTYHHCHQPSSGIGQPHQLESMSQVQTTAVSDWESQFKWQEQTMIGLGSKKKERARKVPHILPNAHVVRHHHNELAWRSLKQYHELTQDLSGQTKSPVSGWNWKIKRSHFFCLEEMQLIISCFSSGRCENSNWLCQLYLPGQNQPCYVQNVGMWV